MKKNPVLSLFGALLVATSILSYFFIRGECHESFFFSSELINHEKVSNYFTSLEAIFFIATLFFAAWQLNESRIARQGAIKTVLFPVQKTFSKGKPINNLFGLGGGKGEIIFTEESIFYGNVQLLNLSRNPGTHLVIEWIYDSEKVRDVIRQNNDLAYDVVIFNSEGQKIHEIAFIKPEQEISIPVCDYYFLMWGNLTTASIKRIAGLGPVVPSLHLKIKFRNIEGELVETLYPAEVYFDDVDNELTLSFNSPEKT